MARTVRTSATVVTTALVSRIAIDVARLQATARAETATSQGGRCAPTDRLAATAHHAMAMNLAAAGDRMDHHVVMAPRATMVPAATAARAVIDRRIRPAHPMPTGPIPLDRPPKDQKNPAKPTPFDPLSLAPGPVSLVPANSGPGCFFR